MFDEVGTIAHDHGFRVSIAPDRVTSVPLVDGEPVSDERFAALSAEARGDLASRTEQFEISVGAAMRRLRQLEREEEERRRVFDRDTARDVIDPLLAELRGHYPDFRDLFKVKVEFAPDVPWSDDATRLCAAFLSRCVRDRGLLPLDASAIARTIEHAARLAGNQQRLSAQLGELADVATEASFRAGKANRTQVGRDDVDGALRARHARSGLLERRMHAAIAHRRLLVETSGQAVGQVNGLAVFEFADSRFGMPARITATVSPGQGNLCSVDGAVDLSGPIHDKAVLTMRGYLARMYGRTSPLTVAATLAFEQSYDAIEGDSASLAELLALLSALADVPLDQGIAVTGAVDQRGQLEPVGEVTCKVEGFFAACREAGLNGRQGVVVPASNALDLVLDEDVVEAVRAGMFHVWTAASVDDALGLLCDQDVGTATPDGDYPEQSIHGRAVARLRRFGSQLASLRKQSGDAHESSACARDRLGSRRSTEA